MLAPTALTCQQPHLPQVYQEPKPPQEVNSDDRQCHIRQEKIPREPPATRCHGQLVDAPALDR